MHLAKTKTLTDRLREFVFSHMHMFVFSRHGSYYIKVPGHFGP